MKIRIVKHNGKIKIQYRFLWWWNFMCKMIIDRDRDIEGDEIINDYLEHIEFESVEEAEIYAHACSKTTFEIEVLKQMEV